MPNLSPGQPETPAGKERPAKGRIILGLVVLLIATFLAGFLPQYAKGMRLANELREATHENRMAELRDLAGLLHLQGSQRNYGLAAGTSTRFFERVREVAGQTPDSGRRKLLEEILSARDTITSGLTKGEPGVVNDLEALFVRTRHATGADHTGTPRSE